MLIRDYSYIQIIKKYTSQAAIILQYVTSIYFQLAVFKTIPRVLSIFSDLQFLFIFPSTQVKTETTYTYELCLIVIPLSFLINCPRVSILSEKPNVPISALTVVRLIR